MKQYKITDFTQDSNDPTSYEGTVVLNGEEFGVSIILEDEGETEKVEQLMSTFFNEIDTLLPKAKECIANEFLDLYNDNWRFGDDEDNPDLSLLKRNLWKRLVCRVSCFSTRRSKSSLMIMICSLDTRSSLRILTVRILTIAKCLVRIID